MNTQQRNEWEAKIKEFNALHIELSKTTELKRFLREEISGNMSEQGRITKIEIHRERWSTNPPSRPPLKTPLTILIPSNELLITDTQIRDVLIPILEKKGQRLQQKIEEL